MKRYLLIDDMKTEMDMEEVIDYLQINLHFTLDKVTKLEDTEKQSELIDILIEQYFLIDEEDKEDEENEEYDDYEKELKEREREYRDVQL